MRWLEHKWLKRRASDGVYQNFYVIYPAIEAWEVSFPLLGERGRGEGYSYRQELPLIPTLLLRFKCSLVPREKDFYAAPALSLEYKCF